MYCAEQLGELSDLLTTVEKENTAKIAVSSDAPEDLQAMVDHKATEREGLVIDYSLLSDPVGSVINRYGLLSQIGPGGRPMPHPTTYVIDKSGRIQWHMTEVDYRVRPENEDILAALTGL